MTHDFPQEQPMGHRLHGVRWLLIAEAIPENDLFLSNMSPSEITTIDDFPVDCNTQCSYYLNIMFQK